MKAEDQDLFEQIGNLFYSIATCQRVKAIEIAELKSLISKDWVPESARARKTKVSDETHVMFMAMDSLAGDDVSADEAYNQFLHFYSLHPELFSPTLKEHILNTAERITTVFISDNPFHNENLRAAKELLSDVKVQ